MTGSWKERVFSVLPLVQENLLVREVSLEELLLFRKATWNDDLGRMTCRPPMRHGEEAARRNFAERLRSPSCILAGVFAGGGMAGRISLNDYNPRNGSVEMGYWLAPDFRGQGWMRRALALFCPAVLLHGGLNKIMVQTASFNEASLRLMAGLGFHEEGRLREHHELEGRLYDDVLFSLTAGDLRAR